MKLNRLIFASCLLSFDPAFADEVLPLNEAVALEFRYQPGRTYESIMTTVASTNMKMNGQEIKNDQTMTMESDLAVSAIEASKNVKAAMTYSRVAMEMETMGQNMGFDSAKPASLEGNPLAGMAGMVGRTVTMTITPDFEVLDLQGLDALFEGLGAGAEAAQGMVTGDQFKQMMGAQFAALIPDRKVKSGDEWPYKMSSSLGPLGIMKASGTNTLKGVLKQANSTVAVIDFKATAKSAPGEDQPEGLPEGLPGMDLGEMKMSGTSHFNLKEGYISKMEMETSMTFSMEIPGGEGKTEVPSTSKMSMTTTMK